MNNLFSDEFATDFASLGNVADWNLLDSGRAGNDKIFWSRVQNSFVQPDPDFDDLRFQNNDVFAAQDHIDIGKFVLHDWKKLQKFGKGSMLTTKLPWQASLNQNFWDFCYDKLDTCYLRKNLEARLQLNDTVEADLPLECALSLDQTDVVLLDSASSSSSVASLSGP
jgi:hypothetical protein